MAEASEARISGVVTIQATIDELGNVLDPHIVKGLPLGLNEKILKAVWTWKYKPATRNGKPVKVSYKIHLRCMQELGGCQAL